MTSPTETPVDTMEQDYPELGEIKALTDRIRNHQRAVDEISKVRKDIILSLRKKRITYREIAAAMGITEQSVYKILRDTIAANKNKQ